MFGMLHHVEIYVSNLAESRTFWEWLLFKLGYECFQEWEEGVSFKKGPTYLVFVQTTSSHQNPTYHRCRTGLNHLAFHLETRPQVDQFREELQAKGVSLLYEDKYPYAGGPDYYAVFFEDPDRIKVELVASEEKN